MSAARSFRPSTGPAVGAERRRLEAGLAQPPPVAARFLLGQLLVRRLGRTILAARIVETEAYLGEDDPAAHAYRGRTARTAPLWGPPGMLYVYFIYGMHHCLNISVEREGTPGCVLIRAAEPLDDVGLLPGSCRGPGRLCRALGLDTRWSGVSAFDPRGTLHLRWGAPVEEVGVSTRIGLRVARDHPLRFFDRASAAVSAVPKRDRLSA